MLVVEIPPLVDKAFPACIAYGLVPVPRPIRQAPTRCTDEKSRERIAGASERGVRSRPNVALTSILRDGGIANGIQHAGKQQLRRQLMSIPCPVGIGREIELEFIILVKWFQ